MLIHFGQSTYFKVNKGIDRYFLENYLLPGLEAQAVISGSSRGIELPVGENQEPEFISLEEAKALVLDWLEQTHNLLEGDKKKLARLNNYKQFANLASNLYQARVQDPNKLITASRLQNIADLRAAKKLSAVNSTPHYDPGKVIDDYNKTYLKLLAHSRIGIPQDLLRQVVSGGIPSGAGNLRADALASVISANLPQLYAAGSLGSNPETQDYAVAKELANIISSSYPEMTGVLNILGDPKTATTIREITTRLAKEIEPDTNLLEYEHLRTQAIKAADSYLLNQAELTAQISHSLGSMSETDRQKLTKAIISEMVASATKPLTSSEILEKVAQKLNIPDSQLASIQVSLENLGLHVSLEHRQNELALMVNERHLTRGEYNLLSKGINPFLVHSSPEKLALSESKLLSEYNSQPGQAKQFTTLREAYLNERESTSPNSLFLDRARSHFDQLDAYKDLSLSDRALVRRTKFGRWITDTRSRLYETQAKFFDKWVDIEETITGKKWLHKQLDAWDKFAASFTIPGTKIPLFRLAPWLADRFDEWKKVSTANILKRTTGSKNWISQSIHWVAKHYELGGYTTSGATAHFAHAQWGKFVKWGLAKTGMTGVVKYAGVSASRTATRLLLKIGGKALAKLGTKALGALITAATTVGTVIFAIGMVFDLISLGWEFLKELARNSKLRQTVVGWGLAIGAFFTVTRIAPFFTGLGLALGAMIAASFQFLLLAFAILGIVLFVAPQIQNNIKNTFRLDSAPGRLITSILCDNDGGGGNPAINTAVCIVQILTDCGLNPLLAGNANTPAWQCALASLVAADAMEVLKESATKYEGVQCVGFVRAVDVATGGPGVGWGNANTLGTLVPSGYTFASGIGSCAPGDIFVDTGGDVGHTGIFISNDGPYIKCADANGAGLGVVRGPDSCVWDSSKIAGCLKKN